MARPHKTINWDIVERLIECGSNGIEIAAKFRIQDDTFYKRFKEEYGCNFQDYRGKYKDAGLADLRLMIHSKAINNKAPGNSNLLIFLAKCKLGYREPDVISATPAHQPEIDKDHLIMELQHRIALLEENAY